jgi:hypothetical protein
MDVPPGQGYTAHSESRCLGCLDLLTELSRRRHMQESPVV